MSGWKTWAGGIGAILGGLGRIGVALSDGFSWAQDSQAITEGWSLIAGGLAVIGIGHKIEKAK
jgi:hypothetical protein